MTTASTWAQAVTTMRHRMDSRPWRYVRMTPRHQRSKAGAVAWKGMVKDKEFIESLIADGRSGKGPRVFFGGYVAGQREGKAKEFVDDLVKEFPGIEITGYTVPLYYFVGPGATDLAPTWDYVTVTRGKPELLEQAVKDGKFFFFTDWVKYSKEQSARFTHGFWFWRLKAPAQLHHVHAQLASGSARTPAAVLCPGRYRRRESLRCVSGIAGTGRVESEPRSRPRARGDRRLPLRLHPGEGARAAAEKKTGGAAAAAEKKTGGAAAAAARKFLDQLAGGLSLDLSKYYESRGGPEGVAFVENWFTRSDNPWTTARLDETRKKCAGTHPGVAKRSGEHEAVDGIRRTAKARRNPA